MATPGSNKGNANRVYPVETLAFAYELRQEYHLRWKAIARLVGIDAGPLKNAVSAITRRGFTL